MGEVPQEQISIRVPKDALKRAERLVPRVARDRNVAALQKVTRATVLKLALVRGLAAMEADYE